MFLFPLLEEEGHLVVDDTARGARVSGSHGLTASHLTVLDEDIKLDPI
jgi:hypothetical protein